MDRPAVKLIFLALVLLPSALEVKGNECLDTSVVYTPSGKSYSCAKCGEGQRVLEDCQKGNIESTKCEDCPPKEFQNCLSSSRLCHDCKTSCEINQVVKTPCTKIQNLECKCKVDHAAIMRGVELVCHPCARPKVVTDAGGGDQKCSACPAGHYYFKNESLPDIPAKCLRCRDCKEIESPCQNDRDAICKPEIPEGKTDDAWKYGVGFGVLGVIVVGIIVGVCIWKRKRKESLQDNRLTEPLTGDHQDSSDDPEINGNDSLIRKAFIWLSKTLGTEWPLFMRELPGEDFRRDVDTKIDHAQLNNPNNTFEQIMQALRQWERECPEEVTTRNIVQTLRSAKEYRHSSTTTGGKNAANQKVMNFKAELRRWKEPSVTEPSSQNNGPRAPSQSDLDPASGSISGHSRSGTEAPAAGGDSHGRATTSRSSPSNGLAPPSPSAVPRGGMFGRGEDVTDGNRRGNPIVPNAVNPPHQDNAPPYIPLAQQESYSDPSPLDERVGVMESPV